MSQPARHGADDSVSDDGPRHLDSAEAVRGEGREGAMALLDNGGNIVHEPIRLLVGLVGHMSDPGHVYLLRDAEHDTTCCEPGHVDARHEHVKVDAAVRVAPVLPAREAGRHLRVCGDRGGPLCQPSGDSARLDRRQEETARVSPGVVFALLADIAPVRCDRPTGIAHRFGLALLDVDDERAARWHSPIIGCEREAEEVGIAIVAIRPPRKVLPRHDDWKDARDRQGRYLRLRPDIAGALAPDVDAEDIERGQAGRCYFGVSAAKGDHERGSRGRHNPTGSRSGHGAWHRGG